MSTVVKLEDEPPLPVEPAQESSLRGGPPTFDEPTKEAVTSYGLAGLLAARASTPFRIVLDLDGELENQTLAEIHTLAGRIAGSLAAAETHAARVLIALPSGPRWYAAFFGALYAGCLPVPVPALRGGRRLARIVDIVAACGAARAIAPNDCADTAARLGLRFDPLADLLNSATLPPREADHEAPAYLQFTSGSTGAPRGAVISHRAALANLLALQGALEPPAESWHASWLPLHHDMGLMMSLMSLVNGGGLTLMTPEAWAQEPWRWLALVSRWRAAVSGAPNFAYDQLCRARPPTSAAALDLSCWRTAFCGGEPVQPLVMRRFARRFAAAGFSRKALKPGYGMAEFTLLASIVPAPRAAATRRFDMDGGARSTELSEVGPVVAGHRVAIVDAATHRPLPDGVAGEIWLDGPSKASGYWGRPEESLAQFQARAHGLTGEFLRSGDLGFITGGSLYVCGRLKELVILRGRNFHPGEIEEAVVAAHPALQAPAAAFVIGAGERDALWVACEVRRGTPAAHHEAILAAIQRELAERLGIRATLLALLRHGSAPRTTSGKIRRLACRTLLEAGDLPTLARWEAQNPPAPEPAGSKPDAARIGEWISHWISARHAMPDGGAMLDQPFQDLGLDSMGAVELVYGLEDWLRLALDTTLLWRYPTPRALAEALACLLRGQIPPALEPPAPRSLAAALEALEALSDTEIDEQYQLRLGLRTQ